MSYAGFRGIHAGARVYVLGNGPSLATADLRGLAGQLTLTCNRGHTLGARWGGSSTYWTIEDVLDAEQFAGEFRRIEGPIRFVPEDLAGYHIGGVAVPFIRDRFDAEGGRPQFGFDPPFYWGGTVSYLMLQIAVWLGATEIVLLGQDFRYTLDGVIESSGEVWGIGDDRNHFDANYWPAGARAFAPQPTRMHTAFVAARDACAQIGVRVVNATKGSALDVFEHVNPRDWVPEAVSC